MPKIVDHDARRREIAQALWALLRREGPAAVTLRRVAAEAGWSLGAVRHYFASHDALLVHAMELVITRVGERIAALGPDPEPLAILEETLPLDDERRAEAQVWLAFTAVALSDPDLRALRDRTHVALRGLCVRVAGGDAARGELLHAAVDGLALHALLDPAVTTPDRQRALLRAAVARAQEA
ncbi:TetR/AcrR family transcriptional regulator [Paraconexibacter algicola]|uniref:TetR family transcriptional regulator n=1 Tax=Paraconexibacter algicola TaxID=2133960 RepID=A0A2T4UMK4_9ACTN|nr:TetR/AcrR family transcriptional regulator [Paraconexibacter algicola]PTL60463.1 TetR family transcriptional regulator [Paraconexibacter algicola]